LYSTVARVGLALAYPGEGELLLLLLLLHGRAGQMASMPSVMINGIGRRPLVSAAR